LSTPNPFEQIVVPPDRILKTCHGRSGLCELRLRDRDHDPRLRSREFGLRPLGCQLASLPLDLVR
jgi:hypothetical protein